MFQKSVKTKEGLLPDGAIVRRSKLAGITIALLTILLVGCVMFISPFAAIKAEACTAYCYLLACPPCKPVVVCPTPTPAQTPAYNATVAYYSNMGKWANASGAIFSNRAYVNYPCSPSGPYYAIEHVVLSPDGFTYQGEFNKLVPPAGQKFFGWRIFQNGKDTGKIAMPGKRLFADYNLLRECGTTTYLTAEYDYITPVVQKYPIYVYYYADSTSGAYLGQDRLPDAEVGTAINNVDLYKFAPPNYTVPGTRSGATVVAATTNIVYVVYTKPQVFRSVSYKTNGGSGTERSFNIQDSTYYTITDQGFYKNNAIFTGWNTKPDGTGTPYYNGQQVYVTGDLILYAQWRDTVIKIPVYITYISLNGDMQVYTDMAYKGDSYRVKTQAETGLTKFAGEFLGWNTLPNGNIYDIGTKYAPNYTFTINDNLVLFAQWRIDT